MSRHETFIARLAQLDRASDFYERTNVRNLKAASSILAAHSIVWWYLFNVLSSLQTIMVGAVPFGFTTLNISGKFIMNATLSDDTDEILQLQGIGWLTRRAIGLASVTLEIKHYKDDEGVEHIDIDEYTTTGGIATTTEHRTLLWQEAVHEDHVFGSMLAKARRYKAEDVKEGFLFKGWTKETYRHGLIQSYVRSNTRKSGIIWSATETWGIEEINGGEKRFTRHVYFTGPQKQVIKARLVYDHSF